MQALLISLLLATTATETAAAQRVYVLGTSLNLRLEPSPEAEVLQQLPIGTECVVLEPPSGEWLKVRCGEREGHAAASLLGAERPSAEKLRAEASNPKLTLAQRLESAQRAATLAPEDMELQKLLASLFFERNFDFVARLKKPEKKLTFSCTCGWEPVLKCLRDCSSADLKEVKLRAELKRNLFVVAIGDDKEVLVYRGRYQLNKKTSILTGEVLERASLTASPVMQQAIFMGIEKLEADKQSLSLGQFVLDEEPQTLLEALPKKWGLLRPNPDGFLVMQWNRCLKEPYSLRFGSDIHGRWRLAIDKEGLNVAEVHWISAVSKRGNELELTLNGYYGGTRHELLKLPEVDDDIGHLGETAYSYNIRRHPQNFIPCDEGGP